MKRNEWIFEISAQKLAEASTEKGKFHTARLKFWEDKQANVLAEVKEKGIRIEESLAGVAYSSKSTQFAPEFSIDLAYQRKLQEANGKIREHSSKIKEYDGWNQVLSQNSGKNYGLNSDDWLFFFGK